MSTDPIRGQQLPVSDIDPTAFDRYAVVSFATPEIRQSVEEIHSAAPPCGLPTLQAHVTVKGTFVEPRDVTEIVDRIDQISRGTPPVDMRADRLAQISSGDGASVVLLMVPHPDLVTLHTGLWNELHPLGKTIYLRETTGEFTPHLTLVQAIQPDEVKRALSVINQREINYTYTARTISLVARRGGTDWETLVEFRLGGGAAG